jgi:hypothetical protein
MFVPRIAHDQCNDTASQQRLTLPSCNDSGCEQPCIDMVRGAVLKFYLIVAALMNSLFVKLRALTQSDAKTRKKR